MGLKDFLKRLAGGGGKESAASHAPAPDAGKDVAELARRLGMAVAELQGFAPAYHTFTVPKRKGGTRTISAPADPLKKLQKCILRRLLGRLKVHPAVRGFERGHSIVTHALPHAGRAVVLHMDIKDFFPATAAKRVHAYFRRIGWNKPAADLLVKLCTHDGGLPQGAPTSPRLSSLVNYRMDERLSAVAEKLKLAYTNSKPLQVSAQRPTPGIVYTRYADDLTFSFAADDRGAVASVIRLTKEVVGEEGYQLHQKKKLRIMRRHDRQMVTGLVVNEVVQLPRAVRLRLRAVRHHLDTGKPASLTEAQLAGWDSLTHMIAAQSQPPQA